jgi:hypothetical protein
MIKENIFLFVDISHKQMHIYLIRLGKDTLARHVAAYLLVISSIYLVCTVSLKKCTETLDKILNFIITNLQSREGLSPFIEYVFALFY